MARINVEERFLKDSRFINLAIKLGSQEKALGWMVLAWFEAQKYWVPDKKPIPKDVWIQKGFPREILEVHLAYDFHDGVKLRGANKNFNWLMKRIDSARKAGKASAENRRLRFGSAQPKKVGHAERTFGEKMRQNDEKVVRAVSRTSAERSFGKSRTHVREISNVTEPSLLLTPFSNTNTNTIDRNEFGRFRFNFEAAYRRYPRKEGKKAGLKKLCASVKDQATYDLFVRAVENYARLCAKNKTELKYIKQFSTFVNNWEDWVDPDKSLYTDSVQKPVVEMEF